MLSLSPNPLPAARQSGAIDVRESVWVSGAAILGFAVPALLAGWLQLSRDLLVGLYAAAVGAFLYGYVRWSGLDIGQFLVHRWLWGVLGAVAVGAVMVFSVQRMAASPRPAGTALLWDLLWLGIVYGIVDALLLSVLPVVAIWRRFARNGWSERWPGKIAAGVTAFAASLGVTAAYHLGYPEFRGPQVIDPLVGNGIVTLGFLLTGSPLTALGAHIALHVATVLHGVETTVSLPPHYG